MKKTIIINGDVYYIGGCCKTPFRGSSEELTNTYAVTTEEMTLFGGLKTIGYASFGILAGVSFGGTPLFVAIGGLTGLLYGLVTADTVKKTEWVEYDNQYEEDFQYDEPTTPLIQSHKTEDELKYKKDDDELKHILLSIESELKSELNSIKSENELTIHKVEELEIIKDNYEQIGIAYRKKELAKIGEIQDAEIVT